jgi:ribosomal-protein-alanine N-acetyltransferase
MERNITTPRLQLRPPREEDASEIYQRYVSDPAVARYVSWPKNQGLEGTQNFVAKSIREWREDESYVYVISLKENEEIIGSIGLHLDKQHTFKAEIGYVLAQDEWGKGYATEALQALLPHALGLDLIRIYARCDVENVGSARVLEKAGFEYEGTLRKSAMLPTRSPYPRDMRVYSIINS